MDLPVSFVESTKALLGEDEYMSFQSALMTEPSVSVRVNSRKGRSLQVDSFAPVPWCPNAYYLEKRPSFTFDPLFHAGTYYVQEASSMFLSQVVRTHVDKPVVALDMCAAPGGKSTLLCDNLPDGSLLVTNEFVRARAHVLAENMTKWGNPDVIVTSNGADAFAELGQTFDFILVDAPCSGEGMFRKDEVAVQEWSTDNVFQCVERQRMILMNVWEALKPGGLLVYSTCTFNLHENEGNVKWMHDTFDAEILSVPVQEEWGITSSLASDCAFPVYRFMPHKTRGEGLFMAVLRKPDSEETAPRKKKKNKKKTKELPVPKDCRNWLNDSDRYFFFWHDDRVMALQKQWQECWEQFSEQLNVIQAGVPVAGIKGKDVIPEHALAMSEERNNVFPTAELVYPQAIAYLRKETVVLDAGVPRGYVCVTYQGAALGWVKNLGNRANNLYPDAWRIRSGHLPENLCLLSDTTTNI
ncbi:MAG: rRNA cytosine-C5-methyltransferase [Bacteroidaceae bacterium]|nr:rRNA cytosine-C5-methyltransferase [Bacteroidaceae bacterium]